MSISFIQSSRQLIGEYSIQIRRVQWAPPNLSAYFLIRIHGSNQILNLSDLFWRLGLRDQMASACDPHGLPDSECLASDHALFPDFGDVWNGIVRDIDHRKWL